MAIMDSIKKYKRFIVLIGLLVGIGGILDYLPATLFSVDSSTTNLIYAGVIIASGLVFIQAYPNRPAYIPSRRFEDKPILPPRAPPPSKRRQFVNVDIPDDDVDVDTDNAMKQSLKQGKSNREDILKGFN